MKTLILDTSPLIALYLAEPTAAWINEQLNTAERLLMSTVNLGECLIILRQRKPAEADMLTQQLLTSSIEFIPPDTAQAVVAASARVQFPLNFGDCFAYALRNRKTSRCSHSTAISVRPTFRSSCRRNCEVVQ